MHTPFHIEPESSAWRFHSRAQGNLFHPIAFGFVTDRMCTEILAERERILSATPASRRAEQHRLLSQYDPRRWAEHFKALLRPFVAELGEAQAG